MERFLLVEHHEPWGASAHPAADLAPQESANVRAAASRLGARLLLVRRPGRRAGTDSLAWGLADARSGHERLSWGTYPSGSLASEPFDPAGLRPDSRPAYLVCTQGRHDQCCAIDGRPVAAALAVTRPETTWECTHVGGDRFAANLLVLPHGFLYGRTDQDGAVAVAEAYEGGHVVPHLLRGRSAGSPALQYVAAEVRRRTGSTGVDDLEPVDVARTGHDRWSVVLRLHGDTLVRAELVESHEAVSTPVTCAGLAPGTVRRFELVAFTVDDRNR